MPRIYLLPWWLTSTSLSGSINPSSPLHGAIWRRENNRGSECGKIVKVCCLARFLPGQSAIPMQKFVGGNSPSRKFRDIQSCLVNWWRHTQISTWGQIRLCANPLLNARFTQIPWQSLCPDDDLDDDYGESWGGRTETSQFKGRTKVAFTSSSGKGSLILFKDSSPSAVRLRCPNPVTALIGSDCLARKWNPWRNWFRSDSINRDFFIISEAKQGHFEVNQSVKVLRMDWRMFYLVTKVL